MARKKDTLIDTLIKEAEVIQDEITDEAEVLAPLAESISLITDEGIKSFVKSILYRYHKYKMVSSPAFWDAPATNIPNVHPADEYEKGGMILHTQRVVKTILAMCYSLGMIGKEVDMLVAAAILHDTTKAIYANEKWEVSYDALHAYTVDTVITFMGNDDFDRGTDNVSNTFSIDPDTVDNIMRLVRCSHGVWSTIPETYPVGDLEKMIAMADGIACSLHVIFFDEPIMNNEIDEDDDEG